MSAAGYDALAGGGELGALMRAMDWTKTPLGPPRDWPLSLKTAVRIMLTSQQPIWIGWGPELTYFYNDAYRAIIGARHPWALGKPTREVWHEIWEGMDPMIAQALDGVEGTYVEAALLIMERNGYPEETYYTYSFSPIPDDSGVPTGIICANTEDTKRVIGERQLALLGHLSSRGAQARDWRTACSLSAEALAGNRQDLPFAAIYTHDAENGAYLLNATSGIAPGHGLAPRRIDPASDFWLAPEAVEPAIVTRLAARAGKTMPSGDWSLPPSAMAVYPIHAPERPGLLLAGLNPMRLFNDSYRDFLSLVAGQIGTAISAAEAYERERQRAEMLAEIDRAKTVFFSNVSHEFRTPLTLMLGPLEELAGSDQGLDPESRELAEVARRNGLRLLRLVNSLLDFARLEAGRVEARYEPLDLAALTIDLTSNFRAACERANLHLEVVCAPLPQPVLVDRDMWEKIVLNLLSNAFKYTLAGGIIVRLETDDNVAVLTVTDTGIGIPPAELPRLFDRFHRIEGQQGRTHEGSGIGLALVQELVGLHGGTITVRSREGQGSTFTVNIPLGTAHLPADRIMLSRRHDDTPGSAQAFVEEMLRWLPAEPNAAGDGGAEPVTGNGGRYILVADDNADMREHIRRLLIPLGHEVEMVGDGEAALEAIAERRPDLILSDVMMPRLDGFGLIAAIRRSRGLRDIPVILLSARAGEEARIEGMEAGADDYLTKPFAARELVARVSASLTAARLRREMAEELTANERRLRGLFEQAPGFIAILRGRSHSFEFVNATYMRLFGGDYTGRTVAEALPEVADQGYLALLDKVFTTGERFVATNMPFHLAGPGGESRDYVLDFIYEPIKDASGTVTGIFVEGHDMSERQRAETALREETRTLDTLNRSGASLAQELDVDRVVQMVTDAGVDLTGAAFGAFFYNVVDAQGESYMLYALSGVERSAFENFPMPRNTAVFAPTFGGEGVIRSADILADPRYGGNAPHKGMPKGHLPVRSYLAVPVMSRTGEVIGGLFFGHPEVDRFDARHERLMVGIAAQAAIAIDNARLYEAGLREIAVRREAEEDLRHLNETLEHRIAEAVAEREEAAEALRQAQKMEAVGQLTGGVAHDFNNLLTIITGNMDMARRSIESGDETRARRAVDNAIKGAERATSLTQRLLAFSRRQPLDPKPLDVDRLVRGISDMLARALGETVQLDIVTAPGLWRVEVDGNQLENCLLNLAVNARDAMPDGGTLTIETANVRIGEPSLPAHAEVAPGSYVVIAVSDTGTGMSRETLARVFEPFFTTKEVGRGTGLGLSMVYGFVKQSGGHVKIYSEEGAGATIKIYLPRILQDAEEDTEGGDDGPVDGGYSETILVTEDDDDVRAYTVEILRELGYHVVETHDGPSALGMLEQPDVAIDLLFTDVVMPGMSGRELADRARALRPALRILFTSGYTRNAMTHNGRLDPGVEMIPKPFTYHALAARVRAILDAGVGGRLLVVDGDAARRKASTAMLLDAGYSADDVSTVTEALGKLRALSGFYTALLLADAHMPETAIAKVRAMHGELPILILIEPEEQPPLLSDDPCVGTIARSFDATTLDRTLTELGVRCEA